MVPHPPAILFFFIIFSIHKWGEHSIIPVNPSKKRNNIIFIKTCKSPYNSSVEEKEQRQKVVFIPEPKPTIRRMSFISSQVDNQVNQFESKEPGKINIESRVSLSTENVCPGSPTQLND